MKQQFKILQKQKLSTKQIQSVELLRLSQQELESFVEESLMDNPFSDSVEEKSSAEWKEADYKIVKKRNEANMNFEIASEDTNDLYEHVMKQLSVFITSKKEQDIYDFLLNSLDSKGFLAIEVDEVSRLLNVDSNRVEQCLSRLKDADPRGLGTQNIQDCILFQLNKVDRSELAISIVQNHLERISMGYYDVIADMENTSEENVREAIQLIQTLKPIPANGFKVNTKTMYTVPDAYVYKRDNQYVVEMNNSIRNKLSLNKDNYELYKNSNLSIEDKKFLDEKLNDFRWLQYSTNRRFDTLQRIITCLVDYQISFFNTGDPKTLKPLRLADISEKLGMHISTISRAITKKYFQCEFGFYPFRFLMPKAYQKENEITSIDTLKGEIKEIISLEDKHHPFSDEKIRQMLEEEGYSISRRSVTLYRNECLIPSSKHRKK